ncbi:uncharacterized protein LOC125676171 isoform X2 [Ostrea edulis]|uniref:uncharacterized protein LOC125676171 isoform X2 n=1 Tax=Ostrea edulis TaxID=37623 RepID=UPI0024AED550|nr:uncharacterized protein LOC125676171 isoform X2 [Ostrea edulis]
MPLTKITPRKPGLLCSICLRRLPSQEEWREHLLACATDDMKKRRFECNQCNKAFAKHSLLIRHQKRLHSNTSSLSDGERNVPQSSSTVVMENDDCDSEWQEDPGDLLYETELEMGRIIRKKTSPSILGVKRKADELVNKVPDKPEDKGSRALDDEQDQEAPLVLHHCPCCRDRVTRLDVSTQTDTGRHQRTVRVVRKYQKDGECVERVEEDIWND